MRAILAIGCLLIGVAGTLLFTQEELKELEVEFTQVASGLSFIREADDRQYSAVIWNAEGWAEFQKKYKLPVKDKLDFADDHIHIVDFSDSICEAFCDGVTYEREKGNGYYYLDLNDTGTKAKRRRIALDQKYSCWVIVKIPRPNGMSHIAIREGVRNGLCHQYGRED